MDEIIFTEVRQDLETARETWQRVTQHFDGPASTVDTEHT